MHSKFAFVITATVAMASSLSGCSVFTNKPDLSAAELQDLAPVVNALKDELRAFAGWAAVYPTRPPAGSQDSCQNNLDPQNDLAIRSAKVELNTQSDVTFSGGVDIPAISAWTFTGPSGSKQVLNEQKFTFDVGVAYVPQEGRKKPSEVDMSNFLLATVIWKLRQQVLNIDHRPPCVQFVEDKKPRQMPLVIGFTAAKTGSGGIKIVPSPLPLGFNASISSKRTQIQTITLSMEVTGAPQGMIN